MKRALGAMLFLVPVAIGCTADDSPDPRPSPATNLLSPAPTPVVDTSAGQCTTGIIRANGVPSPELLDVLGDYAPEWLPDRFGLLHGYQGSGLGMEDGVGAIWADARCRQIRLEFLPGAADLESPRPVGEWVGQKHRCTIAPLNDVRCFSYHAQDDGGVLNLLTVGLGAEDAGRIVDGIALT